MDEPMPDRRWHNRLLLGFLVACTGVSTAITIHRAVRSGGDDTHVGPTAAPVAVDDSTWRTLRRGGHVLGSERGKVTIVEFGDFECPGCAYYNTRVIPALLTKYGRDLTVRYRHYPLSYHRFARPAARASVCAAEQGRFVAMHDALFTQQRSLSTKSPEQFASEAGLENAQAWAACMRGVRPDAIIDADARVAREAGVRGTPSFVVEGLMFHVPPDSATLDSLVEVGINR